jgi:Ca2+-transporting ATPase
MIPLHDLPETVKEYGLTAESVQEMRERYGKNELTPPHRTPLWRQYLEKFNDPIIRILLVAVLRPCCHSLLRYSDFLPRSLSSSSSGST